MQNILFVCTGNTCRSAMAECICRFLCSKENINIKICSCGICANNGESASQNAITALNELYGLDLSYHRSKTVNGDLIKSADKIYTMSKRHSDILMSLFPSCSDKVISFSPEIPDPFMQGVEEYKACAQELYRQIKQEFTGA